QFDRLTKVLAAERSRRGVLRGLAGGLAAAALALVGAGSVAAKQNCVDAGHPCEGKQTCCDQLVCVSSGPGAAQRCTPCPRGTVFCKGGCCAASQVCDSLTSRSCTPTTCRPGPCGVVSSRSGGTPACDTRSARHTCGGGRTP